MNTSTPVDHQQYADLAYLIACQMVEHPKELKFIASRKNGNTIVVSSPGHHAKVDHGKLIGGEGKNFRALQRLLREAARLDGLALNLEIIDPGGKPIQGGEPKPDNPNWTECHDDSFLVVLGRIVECVTGRDEVHFRVRSGATNTDFVILEQLHPEVLNAFDTLWRAIGRNHGRKFRVFCEDAKEKAA